MDDWSEEQIEAIRGALLALRETLDRTRAETRQSASTVDLDQPIGRLSRMDALQQQQMAQAAERRNSLRRRQVDGALQRLDSGDYGYCVACDEPIAIKRLEARPEAPLCLRCQSARER